MALAGVATMMAAMAGVKRKHTLIDLLMNRPPIMGSEWVSSNLTMGRVYTQDRAQYLIPIPYGSDQQWALRALQ